MSLSRLRRLTDLFVRGKEVPLPDGTYLWVQAINSYERDECFSDAQVARARMVMALKANGSERIKVEARMAERGRDAMVVDLIQAKVDQKYTEIATSLEGDPDWSEKLTIIRRTDFTQQASPATEDERRLVEKMLDEYTAELQSRLDAEREWQLEHYNRATDEELLVDYLELWLDKRGGDMAAAEYGLTELWFATRFCDAQPRPDGTLDHGRCNGHPDRVFETKADARSAPDELQRIIVHAINDLSMGEMDPKGSGSAANSSGSSPTPSAAEVSTPSTSTETHDLPPGISPAPSHTP